MTRPTDPDIAQSDAKDRAWLRSRLLWPVAVIGFALGFAALGRALMVVTGL